MVKVGSGAARREERPTRNEFVCSKTDPGPFPPTTKTSPSHRSPAWRLGRSRQITSERFTNIYLDALASSIPNCGASSH